MLYFARNGQNGPTFLQPESWVEDGAVEVELHCLELLEAPLREGAPLTDLPKPLI